MHADPADHAETPLLAYTHVAPILTALSEKQKQPELRLYDPYYCTGKCVEHLNSLGFPHVANRKEDFYRSAEWRAVMQTQTQSGAEGDEPDSSSGNSKTPKTSKTFDVLITNLPYSCDHV